MEDAIVEIVNGIPYLVNRPAGCPKIVVRSYTFDWVNTELDDKPWCKWKTDEKGMRYIEASWGE